MSAYDPKWTSERQRAAQISFFFTARSYTWGRVERGGRTHRQNYAECDSTIANPIRMAWSSGFISAVAKHRAVIFSVCPRLATFRADKKPRAGRRAARLGYFV